MPCQPYDIADVQPVSVELLFSHTFDILLNLCLIHALNNSSNGNSYDSSVSQASGMLSYL
jgi:hypothetical protein